MINQSSIGSKQSVIITIKHSKDIQSIIQSHCLYSHQKDGRSDCGRYDNVHCRVIYNHDGDARAEIGQEVQAESVRGSAARCHAAATKTTEDQLERSAADSLRHRSPSSDPHGDRRRVILGGSRIVVVIIILDDATPTTTAATAAADVEAADGGSGGDVDGAVERAGGSGLLGGHGHLRRKNLPLAHTGTC